MGLYEIAQRAERTQCIGLMSDACVSFGYMINRNTFRFTAAVVHRTTSINTHLLVFGQISSSDRSI